MRKSQTHAQEKNLWVPLLPKQPDFKLHKF